MKRYGVLGVLVVCSGLAAAGMEFDNSVNGTSQEWDFYDASFPGSEISPDGGGQNPIAPATAVLDYGVTTGGYRSWSGDQRGVYFELQNLGVSIEIPNYDNDNPYKEIYVEIVYWGEISDASVTWQGMTATVPDVVEDKLLPDGWREYSAIWTIQPNPAVETIQYSFVPGVGQAEAQLDYILVQTSCIPEPATLLLFGLGGLVLRKKRQG
ncbi:MAG: PEP-CTERM sorting domain-containing protein [Planctomycetes bacterium]|nr:PEP-CTERM sorting domain-containing protein [Planctomycetota bacterium]